MYIRKLKGSEILNVISMICMMSFFFFPYMALYFKVITFYSAYALWLFSCYCMDGDALYGSRRTWLFFGGLLFFMLLFIFIKSDGSLLRKFITTGFISYNWGWALAFYRDKKYLIRRLIPWLFIMFTIGAITTFIGCQQFPMASRILATGTGAYDENMVQMYKRIGIGGYDFIYSIVFLLPSILCLIKIETSYLKKTCMVIMIILGGVCVLQSGYSTGILCMLLGVGCTCIILFSKSENPFPALFSLALGLILLWTFKAFIFELIGKIGDSVGAYYVSIRMTQLGGALSGQGVDSLDRVQLYHNAILKFIDSPLFGNLTRKNDLGINSGHSEVLNYLEVYGIWGIMFTAFLVSSFNNTWKWIVNKKMRVALILNHALIFLFACINRIDSANGVCMIALFWAPIIFDLCDETLGEVERLE